MSSVKNRKRARGSALLVIVYVGAILGCAVGVYFYSSSQNLARETVAHETAAKAREVARLGIEQAVANLANVQLGLNPDGKPTVDADWVGRAPYGTSAEARTERRITGNSMGFDYIVQVRAVRETKEIDGLKPDGWLTEVNPQPYEYGKDLLKDFTGAYEIISTARSAARVQKDGSPSSANVSQAAEASIRTVVSVDYRSIADDVSDFGIYFGVRADLVGPGLAVVSVGGGSGGGGGGGGGGGEPGSGEEGDPGNVGGAHSESVDSTLFAWGEDHYAVRAVAREALEEQVIEGFIKIPRESQLFSVSNGYYSTATQTMQYRESDDPDVINPNIPRMPLFYDAGRSRTNELYYKMISLRDDIPIDQYVFGGKQQNVAWERLQENGAYLRYYFGRSVHLLPNGDIEERSDDAGKPDGHAQTALAIGKIENFLKLYLNYATNQTYPSAPLSMRPGPHPDVTADAARIQAWKDTWRQVPLGYHSKARSYSNYMPPQNRPLDNSRSGPRRRWNVLIWIKNKDHYFLAREYTDPKYMNQAVYSGTGYTPAPNSWNGRYRWFYYKGYQDTKDTRWHWGTNSYATRNGNMLAIHTRFLTLEELLGYKLIKDTTDGVPAKWANKPVGATNTPEYIPIGEVAGGVPDYYLVDGEKQPFLVNGSQFDEVSQRNVTTRSDNYGLTAAMNNPAKWRDPNSGVPKTVFPPPDGIYVLDDATGKYKKHTTLRDFAYEVNIATKIGPDGKEVEDTENPDWREVVDLHMVIEDTLEQAGATDNQYFDMGNTVTLVFPKGTTNIKDDENFLAESMRQWWEGERTESLTGNKADWALSSKRDDVLIATTEGDERLKKYFEKFGIAWIESPVSTITTSSDSEGALAGFHRAKFVKATPTKLEEEEDEDGVSAAPTTGTYYYGLNDLYAIYAASPSGYKLYEVLSDAVREALKDDLPALAEALAAAREAKAVALMRTDNPGVTFKYLDERFDTPDLNDDHLGEDVVVPLHMPTREITDRYITSRAFGVANSRGPTVYVKEDGDGNLSPLTNRDLNPTGTTDPLASVVKLTNFLPGELSLWAKAVSLDVPSPEPDNYQTHVPMMYRRNGTLQPDGQPLTGKFIWESGTILGSDGVDREETMDTLYDVPDWFTVTASAILADNPAEHRGALGWHRAGPHPDVSDAEDPAGLLLKHRDHYEFVVMARKGFNPYRTISANVDGDGNKTYLAAFPPTDGDISQLQDYKHKLVPADEMPTFVFENAQNELDGAGVLVVNGNLTVRGTFAYHGLLVVMGNLRVEAVDEFLTDASGNYLDADGNVLTQEPLPVNRWYYYDENNVKHYSERVKVWKGEVIVQGKLMVGHETITDTGRGEVGDTDFMPPGRVEVRGSRGAIDDTIQLWSEVAPYEQFESVRHGWSTDAATSGGYSLWGD